MSIAEDLINFVFYFLFSNLELADILEVFSENFSKFDILTYQLIFSFFFQTHEK